MFLRQTCTFANFMPKSPISTCIEEHVSTKSNSPNISQDSLNNVALAAIIDSPSQYLMATASTLPNSWKWHCAEGLHQYQSEFATPKQYPR
jgi:hypothetical protein